MRPINLVAIFNLDEVRRLHDLEPGDDARRCLGLLTYARTILEDFILNEEHQRHFPLAIERARFLRQRVDDTIGTVTRVGAMDWIEVGFDDTRQQLNAFTELVTEEMRRVPAFTAERVRAYDPVTLLAHAEDVFGDDLKTTLFDLPLDDIRNAARALLFDLPTGGGFYAMRAMEFYARRYWEAVFGKPIPDKTYLNAIIDQLESHLSAEKKRGLPATDTDALELLVAQLRPIKDILRNPISHPENILTRGQATDVFEIAARVISGMIRDGERRRAGSMKP